MLVSYLFHSFHNKLKTNPRYLNHRTKRRCENLIEVLLNIEEDMFFERMRKENILSTNDASLEVEADSGMHIGNKLIQ